MTSCRVFFLFLLISLPYMNYQVQNSHFRISLAEAWATAILFRFLKDLHPDCFFVAITSFLFLSAAACWLLCVARNCDWPRKISPLSSNLVQMASDGMKTYSKRKSELRNLYVKENAGNIRSVFVIRAAL